MNWLLCTLDNIVHEIHTLLYNFILPVLVLYMGKNILSKRPTGYGDTDITESNPDLKKYKNILIKVGKVELKLNPIFVSIFIFAVIFFIGYE